MNCSELLTIPYDKKDDSLPFNRINSYVLVKPKLNLQEKKKLVKLFNNINKETETLKGGGAEILHKNIK